MKCNTSADNRGFNKFSTAAFSAGPCKVVIYKNNSKFFKFHNWGQRPRGTALQMLDKRQYHFAQHKNKSQGKQGAIQCQKPTSLKLLL